MSSTPSDQSSYRRRSGGIGGSSQTTPTKQRTRSSGPTAIERAYETLGEDIVKQLQATYRSLDSRWGGTEHAQAEGMVLSLIHQGVPDGQIRAIFGVGGSMISRLKRVIKDGVDTLHTRREPVRPKHAFTDDDIAFFMVSCKEWELEGGFPCSHRRQRHYLVEPRVTWKLLWQRYCTKALSLNRRAMKYSRWTQYVHLHFPCVRLARTKEDLCDACVRIEIALEGRGLTEDERRELEAEKATHLDAAINQRRAMSGFIKRYAATHAPQQQLPDNIIPDHSEVPMSDNAVHHNTLPDLQIQIEDFGGSFPLPLYGSMRPSADYFNSNLMMQNFVIADITNSLNHVLVYDERGQGKGADALCSLRLLYHLRLRDRYLQSGLVAPEQSRMLLLVLDNCVGQNKSRVVFAFYAMLSIVFYKKVVLLYLLPGHSHNAADRVVAWCRNNMARVNLYSPEEIIAKMNETTAYFKNMPSGYTANYFFEIDSGVATIRRLVTTEEDAVARHSLIGDGDPAAIRRAFLKDLFGDVDLDKATIRDVRLQRQPTIELTTKKLKSLSLKYFSIPAVHMPYYPTVPVTTEAVRCAAEDAHDAIETEPNSKRKLAPGAQAPPKKQVGRPRKLTSGGPKHPSILSFFKPVEPRQVDN